MREQLWALSTNSLTMKTKLMTEKLKTLFTIAAKIPSLSTLARLRSSRSQKYCYAVWFLPRDSRSASAVLLS